MTRTACSLRPPTLWALAAALAISSVGDGARAGPELGVRGPYVQNVTSASAWVVWETDRPATGHLRYGPRRPTLVTEARPPATRHEVLLQGLQPDTSYAYVVHSGDVALSGVRRLRTAPPHGSEAPFRFLVLGDTRSGRAVHAAIVRAALAEPELAFALHTGDLVAGGEREAEWRELLEVAGPLLASVALYPALGNHDDDSAGGVGRWERTFVLPESAEGGEHFYSVRWGNIRVIVLDGQVHVGGWQTCLRRGLPERGCYSEPQLAWLQRTLTVAAQDPGLEHIVVMAHSGPYSSVRSRTGSAQLRALLPWLVEHGVDLLVTGHDHLYEHGVAPGGLHYVVTGGGGAPLYQVAPNPLAGLLGRRTLVASSEHHYLIVEVQGERLEVVARTPSGRVLDRFWVGTTGEETTTAPAGAAPDPAAATLP